MPKLPKDYRPLVKAAREQGWTLVQGSGHPKLVREGQSPIVLSGSPSDKRALKNTVAEMRRRGIDV